jgi:hypothetical protein
LTLALLLLCLFAIQAALQRGPAVASAGPVEPVLIILTAAPSRTPTPTPRPALPTPFPTFTPIPTPDNAIAPPEITAGFYAVVANTDELGLTVRGGPGTQNVILTVVREGTIVLVLDGPSEADDFLWWQLQLPDGTEGWAVERFLEPAAAP